MASISQLSIKLFEMCHLELKSIHIISIYVTFQPGTFSKLGGNVLFGIKSTHVISIYVTSQPGKFKRKCVIWHSCYLYMCNISARHVFEIRRKCVVLNQKVLISSIYVTFYQACFRN